MKKMTLIEELIEVLNDNPIIEEHYPEIIGDVRRYAADGKLRVAEEVELVPPIWNCNGTGCGWDGAQPGPYCPGCGNPIKR